MNTLTTKRRHSDRGASLAEILITVFLIGVVGTLIAGTVIAAMKTTRATQSGVEGQSQLNDALSRIARDVASADPLLATTTSWGTGVGASPSATELWTQAVIQYKCVRTRYWLDTTGSTKALKSATQVFPGETCPDPTTAVSTPAPNVKTIIKDFKDTTTSGTVVPVFTYYNKANAVIPAPIARADIAKIARVKIDVGSNVRERGQGVRLSTSATPRSLDGSLVTGVPAPVCNTYTSTDSTATVIGADLTGGHDTAYVTSPTLTWKTADYGDTYVLRRQNTDSTGNAIPGSWVTVGTYTSGRTITDTAMRGRYGRDLNYELDVTGPGGTVTCGVGIGRIANKPPAPPVLTATVTPDTRNNPWPSDFTQSDAQFSWTRVAEAERYQFHNRRIDANTAPYNATGTGAWGTWNWPFDDPTTSTPAGMFFDDAYEWHLVAWDMDWVGPDGFVGVPSQPSNTAKTLAHPHAPLIRAIRSGTVARNSVGANETGPVTDGTNRISWDVPGMSTIDGFRVWKRPTGTTGAYTPASGNLASTARSFDDTGVPLGTSYDYIVTAFNNGPRGTGANAGTITYYGRSSNVGTILQYPDIPAATATGSEANGDGTNRVAWPAVPSATLYEIWEYNSPSASAVEPANPSTFYGVGNVTAYNDTGNSRATRNYYAVVSRNATGYSRNHNVTGGGANRQANLAVAYQRPNTPPMTWNTQPGLNEDASVGNATIFNYTRNADDGEASDKYCADASLCWYSAYRENAHQETETGNTGDGIIGAMGQTTWWGSTANWYVYSCNPGGCSEPHTVGTSYYPGPFAPKLAVFGDYRTLDQWGKGGGYSRTWTGDGGANYNWTRSYGATWWAINRTPIADDPFNYGGSQWYNTGGTYSNLAPGWTRDDTTNSTGGNQQLQDANGNPMRPWGTPGSVQRFSISAVAANGLSRFNSIDYQQKAAPVKFMETARACTTSNANRWRVAGRINAVASLYDAYANGPRNLHTGHFRVTSFAARRSGNIGGALTQGAADYEYISVSDGQLKSNGGVFDDGQWMLDGWQDTFWYHQGIANGYAGTAIGAGGMFSAADASWNMPKDGGVGAALRATGFTTFADAHAVADGDWGGVSVSLNEFTTDGAFVCPSSHTSWAADLDTISRSSVMGGGSALDPSAGAGRSWGLSGN